MPRSITYPAKEISNTCVCVERLKTNDDEMVSCEAYLTIFVDRYVNAVLQERRSYCLRFLSRAASTIFSLLDASLANPF
jgi:hypothetical protein